MRQYTFWVDRHCQYHRRYKENGKWIWHWFAGYTYTRIEINQYERHPWWVLLPDYDQETYPSFEEAKLWAVIMPREILYNKERQDDTFSK